MPDSTHQDAPKFQLSLVQIIAAAASSITSAVVLSYFGVAGTIIGTAIGSIVSTVGVAVFAHTMRTARRGVTHVAQHHHSVAERQDRSATPAPRARGGAARSTSSAWNHRGVGAPAPSGNSSGFGRWILALPLWGKTLLVFGFALLVLVTLQLAVGAPLWQLVRGETTRYQPGNACAVVGCDHSTATPAATPPPTPGTQPSGTTPVPAVSPTVAPTTHTVTPSPTTAPTSTPTAIPTPQAATTPTGSA